MQRLTTLLMISTTVSFLFLAGCGQSGPLYIPGNPSTMAVPPENPADDEEARSEESGADATTPDQ